MTAPTTTPEITRYRDAVRAALADLSANDRDDLMEDVESHLIEVAAEDDGSLARLGSPQEYAAELRTSAGLPAPSAPAPGRFWDRQDAALARVTERMRQSPQGQALRTFLPELRPGWWVLRGYLVAWALSGFTAGHDVPGLLPRLGGSVVLGLLLTVLAIWGSVRLGRYAQARRSLRPWIVVATVLLLLGTIVQLDRGSTSHADVAEQAERLGLVTPSNVYVFDSEGRPLTGVQLFDQDGNPLFPYDQVYDVNGMPAEVLRRFEVGGQEVFNVYPREMAQYARPWPNIRAPRLAPAPPPSIAASPGATPSVAPSGAVTPSARPTPR